MSVGRLRSGATIPGLEAEFAAIYRRVLERLPQEAVFSERSGYTVRARLWRDTAVGDLRTIVVFLQAIVSIVLLIASANVANLQIARIVARRRELAVRAALGASRWRLVRLVFLETLVLAAAGGVCGLACALLGFKFVRALGLDQSARGFVFALDPAVLGFTAAAVFVAAAVAGLLPLIGLLRDGSSRVVRAAGVQGAMGGSRRLSGALVVFQLAASVALLVGAGLLTKSFDALQREGPGFDAEGVWTGGVALPAARYETDAARRAFFAAALRDLAALPGVTAAALTTAVPFGGEDSSATIQIDGYELPDGVAPPIAELRSISEHYFEALDVPLIEGRSFVENESEPVAVVTDTLARAFWPGRSALGERVRIGPTDEWHKIVGVVPRIKHTSFRDDPGRHTVYWHYAQRTAPLAIFTLRSSLSAELLTSTLRESLVRLDPDLSFYDVQPLTARIALSLAPQRTPTALALVFAGVACILAVVGIYGVLSWAVSQRVGEIGIRMALGAHANDVQRLVIAQGVRLLTVGMVLGIGAALSLGGLLSAQLYSVSAYDPLVFSAAVVTLTICALVASWIPARRAALTDPMRALRAE
jgi:predicted permease